MTIDHQGVRTLCEDVAIGVCSRNFDRNPQQDALAAPLLLPDQRRSTGERRVHWMNSFFA